MDNDLDQAFQLVSQGNNSLIKQGQAKLNNLKLNSLYPLGLLQYIRNTSSQEFKLRAAIELKLWCQAYAKQEEQFVRNDFQQVIEEIKGNIVFAYLEYKGKVSQTLRFAIVSLSKVEFPRRWGALMNGLVQYGSNSANFNSILSILQLISEITKKYSYLSRSDALYEQINIVCDEVHDFILGLTTQIMQAQNLNKGTLDILMVLMEIFYNLNYQDLHPKFQDNLNNWMNILKQIMNFNDSTETFLCKGAALQSILLYASKYKQDVEQAIKGFSREIWNLCQTATDDPEYDPIVFNCLKYFKSLILWADMRQFFASNLAVLIDKLIVPNLKLDKNKMQMFQDQPDTFFQYYFKNNQINTRRSAALELLRIISRHYPNFQAYVINRIQSTNRQSNSEACNLLNFIIDCATKGFRDVDGCTDTYINCDIILQCYTHVVYEKLKQIYGWLIQNKGKTIEENIDLILLVTIMRFLYFFRIYLPNDNIQLYIQFCSEIQTKHRSIRQLVLMVMNAFVTLRHGDFQHFRNFVYFFNDSNCHNIAKNVLTTIYKFDQPNTTLDPNITRLLYTISKILSQSITQYYEYFDALFKEMLKKTEVYDFTSAHLLFQSIGIVAFWISKNNEYNSKASLQQQIFEYFNLAVKRGSDLLNFCFQILAIFLEFQNKDVSKHNQIYQSILNPSNWVETNLSIMSSNIQYISSYLNRANANLLSDKNKFQVILSKLVQLEHYDLFYRFLDSILLITNINNFYETGYFKIAIDGTWVILKKSNKAKKQAMIFIFKLMTQNDIKVVLGYINSIYNNFFESMVENFKEIIRTMQNRRDRKMMYSALCNSILLGILNQQVQGDILNCLIDNSTNRFGMMPLVDNGSPNEKKQSTYQKLQIFAQQLQQKQPTLDIDQQVELCKAYLVCRKQNRPSYGQMSQKNHERMKRLIEKHEKQLHTFI